MLGRLTQATAGGLTAEANNLFSMVGSCASDSLSFSSIAANEQHVIQVIAERSKVVTKNKTYQQERARD